MSAEAAIARIRAMPHVKRFETREAKDEHGRALWVITALVNGEKYECSLANAGAVSAVERSRLLNQIADGLLRKRG